MTQEERLKEKYKKFCLAEGSQHIASEYAISKLQELVETFKVVSILEVGLGIGAIAGSLLEINKDLNYIGTEDNEFCLISLKQNLLNNYKRVKLHRDLNDINQNERFDLIIIDGKDPGFQKLFTLLSPNGIIAIEGDRQRQQDELQIFFSDHLFVHCISGEKNKLYSPFSNDHWQGGLKIIFINPTFYQKMWVFKEKITSKWRYLVLR